VVYESISRKCPVYYTHVDKDHGYLRLGFAEHNESEIKEVMKRLKKVILELGGE